MKKEKQCKHKPITEIDLGERGWVCDEKDVLMDLKFFMKEYYSAFFSEEGNFVQVKFNNGQRFKIMVEEII